jgi:hypothetical protein
MDALRAGALGNGIGPVTANRVASTLAVQCLAGAVEPTHQRPTGRSLAPCELKQLVADDLVQLGAE